MNDNEQITLPAYLLRTLRPDGYFRRFYDLISVSALSHVEAFEAIEDERERFGLPPGYDNYHSFRRCKSYHMGSQLVRIET